MAAETSRVIRGGKVLDTDTDKILLTWKLYLIEENGHVLNVELIDKVHQDHIIQMIFLLEKI